MCYIVTQLHGISDITDIIPEDGEKTGEFYVFTKEYLFSLYNLSPCCTPSIHTQPHICTPGDATKHSIGEKE